MPAQLYRPGARPFPLRRRPWAANTTQPVGGLAPVPVRIPFSWISPPLVRRPTTAVTKAQIEQAGGATAYSSATTAQVAQYGVNTAQTSLNTGCDADPLNLATFLTTFQAIPRPRHPTLTFQLIQRTDAECLLILGVALAQRVQIVEAPTGIPPGALDFTIEGVGHSGAVDNRTVTWATAAIIGTTSTAPGPWFRWGSSSRGGTDQRPF